MNITKQRKTAQNKNMRSNIISYRIGRIRNMLDTWNRIANKKSRSYLPDIERISDMHMQDALDEIRGMNARFVITELIKAVPLGASVKFNSTLSDIRNQVIGCRTNTTL